MPTASATNITINAYIATSLAQAQGWAAVVDLALGYPKQGTQVGGGKHVSVITTTYDTILPHPTLAQWAYVSDQVTSGILAPNAVNLLLPAPVALDTTWFGATAVQTQPLFSRRNLIAAAGIAVATAGTIAGLSLTSPSPSQQNTTDASQVIMDAGIE